MSEIIIGGAPSGTCDMSTYTISLGDLDLSHLTKFIQNPKEEKKPLWSKRHLDGESEYYHVEIVAEDVNENDCYFEPSDSYLCHICNLDVPKIYFKEHIEGSQHQTLKNICENVLDRVSKQINIGFINTDSLTKEDVYYCVPCSKVVKNKNKYKHEASDYHTESQTNDTIINDFFKLCTDDKHKEIQISNDTKRNCDENENTISDDSKTRNCDENVIKISDASKKDKNKTELCEICNIYIYIDKNSFTNHINARKHKRRQARLMQALKTDNTIKDKLESNTNLKLKTDNTNKYDVEYNNNCINNEVNEDSDVKILSSEDDFVSVSSDSDIDRSIVTKSQATAATSNLDLFKTVAICAKKSSFEMYLQEMITKYELNIPLPPIDGDFIDITTPNGTKLKVTRDQFHGYKRNVTNVHCQVCRMIISPNTKAHDIAEWHVRNIFTPVNDDFTRKLNKDWSHCLLCNKAFLFVINHNNNTYHKKMLNEITSSQTSVNGASKQKKARKLNKKNKNDKVVVTTVKPGVKVPGSSEYCDICKVKVPAGGIDVHNAGKPHKNKLDAVINKKHVININIDSKEVQNVTKAKPNMMPISSIPVKESKAKDIHGNTSNNLFSVVADKNVVHGYLLRYTDDTQSKVKCRICDVNFPIDNLIISDHMQGSGHAQAKEKLYVFHKINEELDTCTLCGDLVWDFFEHINCSKHILNFQKTYVIDTYLLKLYVYEDPICNPRAIKYRELYQNLIASNKMHMLSGSNFYCEVCRVKMERVTEIDHMLSYEHIIAMLYRE